MIWYSLGIIWGKKYMTQLRIRPRTTLPFELSATDGCLSALRPQSHTTRLPQKQPGKTLSKEKAKKGLTDDAASISGARLALF